MTKEARMAKRGKRREDACALRKSGSCRTKRSKPLPCISHEVLWSAMRPRIALTCRDHVVRVLMLVLLTIAPISIFGAAKSRLPAQLSGYKAVRVRYGPLNKMIMSVSINGQPANLLVDTGANQIILDADAAESFGVRPSQRGLRYIRFTEINGQILPVGFAQSLTAGTMNFGSSLVALRNSSISGHFSNRVEAGNPDVDGFLGLDILIRHKAVINCWTKLIFFKVNCSRTLTIS